MDENISKALLIAGEVLIGVIIASILVVVFNRVSEFTGSYREYSDMRQIVEFNTQFTQYITNNTNTDATYIYAEDVVTLANQAIDWNRTTPNSNERITVTIKMETETIIATTGTFDGTEFIEKYKLRNDPTSPEYRFSCEVTLNNTTGRVNTVTITSKGTETT